MVGSGEMGRRTAGGQLRLFCRGNFWRCQCQGPQGTGAIFLSLCLCTHVPPQLHTSSAGFLNLFVFVFVLLHSVPIVLDIAFCKHLVAFYVILLVIKLSEVRCFPRCVNINKKEACSRVRLFGLQGNPVRIPCTSSTHSTYSRLVQQRRKSNKFKSGNIWFYRSSLLEY